jgi:glutathione S-transferase
MHTLVGTLRSPFVRRTAVTLDHYGIQYQHEDLLAASFKQQERIRHYNPVGRVPSLVLPNSTVLVDSTGTPNSTLVLRLAIIEYSDAELAPAETLLIPRSGMDRHAINQLVPIS